MAEYLMSVKCGEKTYHLSFSGSDVYFSTSSRTGGTRMGGVKFKNNEIRLTDNGKEPTDAKLCQLIKKSNSGGGCFITTVVCSTLGKPDDCEELTALRAFRDSVMSVRSDWASLVDDYDTIAPAIASRLAASPDQVVQCQGLYQGYLEPCLRLIREQRHQEAIDVYVAMVAECQRG